MGRVILRELTSNTFTRPALDKGQERLLLVGRVRLAAWMDGGRLDI